MSLVRDEDLARVGGRSHLVIGGDVEGVARQAQVGEPSVAGRVLCGHQGPGKQIVIVKLQP